MAKICDLEKGAVIEINGVPHMLEDLTITTPSARGGATLYRMRFRNLVSKQKYDGTYKGEDSLPDVDFERKPVQFSYKEQDTYVFMDLADYNEIRLSEDMLETVKPYLREDLEDIVALVADGRVLCIELPSTVELKIVETGPSIKGASATARSKPATLSTGLVVQVPEYMSTGEVVRVDTRTGKMLGRA